MKKLALMSVIIGLLGALVVGCATTPKGPADEELIAQRIQDGIAAIKAKNLDAFDGMVSSSFESYLIGDKDDLLNFLENADAMGFLDALEIDLAEAQTEIDGEKATVSPVAVSGSFGSLSLMFEGAKENGVWVISSVQSGY